MSAYPKISKEYLYGMISTLPTSLVLELILTNTDKISIEISISKTAYVFTPLTHYIKQLFLNNSKDYKNRKKF